MLINQSQRKNVSNKFNELCAIINDGTLAWVHITFINP